MVVTDNEKPKPNCPANITQANDGNACSASVVFAAAPTDNCGVAGTVYKIGATTITSPHTFPVGVTTVDVTVTDIHGNSDGCSFTVTVNDTQHPAITCPADIAVNNDAGLCSAVVTYTAPVGTDNCAGASTAQTAGLASGAAFPVGTTVNTFEVTDAAGNKTSCSFNVVVTDNEKPVPHCPGDITQANDANACQASVSFAAAPTDNCGVGGTVYKVGAATITSPHVFPVGVTTVDVTVTDIHGNSDVCSFTVTVNDTQPPAITCPPAQDLTADTSGTVALPDLTVLTVATDNCGTPVLSQAPVAGALLPVGTTTVVITATDGLGNIITCNVAVTVALPEAAITLLGTGDAMVFWTAPAAHWNLYWASEVKTAGTVWTQVDSALYPYHTNGGKIYILVPNPAAKPSTFYRLKP